MKKNQSKIGWCDFTFNTWRGCHKRSPGCQHCYAETLAKRAPKTLGTWGPNQPRVLAAKAMLASPHGWNRFTMMECPLCSRAHPCKTGETPKECESGCEGSRFRDLAAGFWIARRPRVFSASMSDIGDEKVPDEWRNLLFNIVEQTPRLDWMLLTKEPENLHRYLIDLARRKQMTPKAMLASPLRHVWIGVSAENQEMWDRRVKALASIPASIRFVSCEPLLGPINTIELGLLSTAPNWIITGGESGRGARPCEEAWQHQIALNSKGWGAWVYQKQLGSHGRNPELNDLKGEKALSWKKPPIREHPKTGLELDPRTGEDPREQSREGELF